MKSKPRLLIKGAILIGMLFMLPLLADGADPQELTPIPEGPVDVLLELERNLSDQISKLLEKPTEAARLNRTRLKLALLKLELSLRDFSDHLDSEGDPLVRLLEAQRLMLDVDPEFFDANDERIYIQFRTIEGILLAKQIQQLKSSRSPVKSACMTYGPQWQCRKRACISPSRRCTSHGRSWGRFCSND